MKRLYTLLIILFAFNSIGLTQIFLDDVNLWTVKTIKDEYGVPTDKYLFQEYDKTYIFVLKNEIAFKLISKWNSILYFSEGIYELILIEDDGKRHNFVLHIYFADELAKFQSPIIIPLLKKNNYIRFEINIKEQPQNSRNESRSYINNNVKGSINCKGFTAMYNEL